MKKKLEQKIVEEIRYHVSTGEDKNNDEASFQFWKNNWLEIYKSLESKIPLRDEEYFSQDKITLLKFKNEFIGCHLLKKYSVSEIEREGYFSDYDESFFSEIEKRNLKTLQSQQYFFINPKWSARNTRIDFGAILACLSLKQQIDQNIDASITIARKDLPVTNLALKLGFEVASESELHNVPVSLLICSSPKNHPKSEINDLANYYWNAKIDTSIETEEVA